MNIPAFLTEKLTAQVGEETARRIFAGFEAKRKTTLRVNRLKAEPMQILKALADAGLSAQRVPWSGDALILDHADEGERQKADSLLQTLQKERRLSYAKIREYEKKMTYMREVMTGYIRQIDSLNTINKKLVSENSSIRKKILDYRLRAESAEEKSQELSTKVRQGSVIRARDIRLVALSKSDREVSRANRAERLRVDLVLVGNELSTPGERNVYTQIIGPDGYPLVNGSNALFDFEGSSITYSAMRSVDYQNNDLNVSLFYNGPGITSGKYQVKIYTDGHMIGSSEISLR